ncbi:hypothetical protein Peur_000688 [Populus x canadensis]
MLCILFCYCSFCFIVMRYSLESLFYNWGSFNLCVHGSRDSQEYRYILDSAADVPKAPLI